MKGSGRLVPIGRKVGWYEVFSRQNL